MRCGTDPPHSDTKTLQAFTDRLGGLLMMELHSIWTTTS